jgi:hypothetical protein
LLLSSRPRRNATAGSQRSLASIPNKSDGRVRTGLVEVILHRHESKRPQRRIAAAASVDFNAAKPLFEYQTSMLRLLADNFELLARNYEKGLEAFSSAIEQQHFQSRQ